MGKEDQNTLENNLKAVEALRRDLSAIISVEKGTEGYWKEDHVGTRGGSCDTIIDVYIEGTPDVTKPDIETREKAKAELKQMYNSSDWYSARYAAGKALKMPKEELYSDLKTWVEKLSSEMRPPITKKVKVGEHEEYVGPVWTHDFNMKPYHRVTGELVTIDDFKDEPIEENIPRVEKATKDMEMLYRTVEDNLTREILSIYLKKGDQFLVDELMRGTKLDEEHLKKIYGGNLRDITSLDEAIKRAGYELGYPNIKIWARLHPIKATLTGLAIAGAASGAVYAIAEYFAK